MRLLLAVAALVLSASPLHADDGKAEPGLTIGHGIICNTSEQAKRFVKLRNDGSGAGEAIQVINREEANPSACGGAVVAFRPAEQVHESRLRGRIVQVMKVVVKAISNGGRWQPVPDLVQYALVMVDGIEV